MCLEIIEPLLYDMLLAFEFFSNQSLEINLPPITWRHFLSALMHVLPRLFSTEQLKQTSQWYTAVLWILAVIVVFTPPQFHCRAWLLHNSRPWLPTPCAHWIIALSAKEITVSVTDQENPVYTQGSGWSLWSEPRLTWASSAQPDPYFTLQVHSSGVKSTLRRGLQDKQAIRANHSRVSCKGWALRDYRLVCALPTSHVSFLLEKF